jgi:hypothetical protein
MCSNMEGSRGFGVVDVLVGALMGDCRDRVVWLLSSSEAG